MKSFLLSFGRVSVFPFFLKIAQQKQQKCFGILPVCSLSTPFQCVSFICLRLIFYSSVNLSQLSVYPWLFFFLLLRNIYQTICFVIASINYDSCEHTTLTAVATDYNKTVPAQQSRIGNVNGFLIHLFWIFCDEKAFDRASYWQVTTIPYHMMYVEFLIRL